MLQDKGLKQLHLNYMAINKTRLLECNSIYCINMNIDTKEMVKNCPTHVSFQAT